MIEPYTARIVGCGIHPETRDLLHVTLQRPNGSQWGTVFDWTNCTARVFEEPQSPEHRTGEPEVS